jgi:hypothetical protein
MVKAIHYRVEQFLRALNARRAISEERVEQAAQILTLAARALFVRQAPQDQRHALDVYETLCQEGHTHEDLLTAALLHDVGKVAAQLPAWQRGIFVLAERFAPGMLDRALSSEAGSRRSSLADYAGHAAIGAHWAEKVGCSPLSVALIRRHEEQLETCQTEEDRLLATLQAADCQN